MKTWHRPMNRDNTQPRDFAINRRGILMAVIGGTAGLVSSPALAGGDPRETATPATPLGQPGVTDGMALPLQNLKKLGPDRQVRAIVYRHDIYRVVTADDQSTEFLETNLRFRIDSSDSGPHCGKPVILPTGMVGDRASVFFASPDEIGAFVKYQG